MAINKEIWVKYIIENLFKDNSFVNYSFDESGDLIGNGTVVHIPKAGEPSKAKINRTQLPATISRRQDVDVLYALDYITSDPRLISEAEKAECSYNKLDSILGEDTSALTELAAEQLLYKWSTNCMIIRTSGGSVEAHVGTGNRKALLAADLKKAQKLMNKLNIPKKDRYALIDTDMAEQLQADATWNTGRDASRIMNLEEGTIGRLYGFTILERSSVLVATNAQTPVIKDPNPEVFKEAATDNAVTLCWQKNEVARAIGAVNYFERIDDPQNYGDVYSASLYAGGRSRRGTNPGVVAIIQQSA
jgi:hypothetical protein